MTTPATLHLDDVETVMSRTGMSRDRVEWLRTLPRPTGNPSFRLLSDWMEANALRPDVNARLAQEILERLGPKTGRRQHDTGTGPIAGISGGLTLERLRSGHGPCQRCSSEGPLRLMGSSWLCEEHARRQASRDRLRELVQAA